MTEGLSSKLKYLAAAAVAAAAVLAAVSLDLQSQFRVLLAWVQSLGPWGPALFLLIYVAACVLGLPGSILTLGAGAIFGVLKGSVLVSVSATLGATAAFLIGRYLARGWVSRKIEAHAAFKAIDEAVEREGWKIVGLTRLSPAFPFNLLNYGFGVTRVSLRDYFFASWIGMLPGTIMYVYLGSLVGDLAALGARGRSRAPAEWALYGVGLAATVVVTVTVSRIARQALQKRTG